MLKIRLQRVGRKHEPRFRLVLTDSKNSTKSGKFLEILGNYDATHGEDSQFKSDRIKHWISVGAKASGTVHNLLIDKKVIEGKKINVLPKKLPILKESEKEEEKSTEKLEEKMETVATPEETKEETVEEVPVSEANEEKAVADTIA